MKHFSVNAFVAALEQAQCPPVELPVLASNFLSVRLLTLSLGAPRDGAVS